MLSYSPRETFRLFSHLPPQRLIHQPGLISLTSSTHPTLVYFPPSPRVCPGQSCCHLSSWQTERCSLAPSLLFLLSSGSISMRQLESSISNGNQTALAPAWIPQGLPSHQASNKTTEPSPAMATHRADLFSTHPHFCWILSSHPFGPVTSLSLCLGCTLSLCHLLRVTS